MPTPIHTASTSQKQIEILKERKMARTKRNMYFSGKNKSIRLKKRN
jgi:hypothetical protein